MNRKRIKSLILLTVMLLALQGACLTAFAGSWYDVIHSGSYETIQGADYVSESFYGVPALYNEGDSMASTEYQCNELVNRFYKDAYGLDIFCGGFVGIKMFSEGYEFRVASTPKPGDIVFASSANRNGKGDHWAIVKSYSGGTITLFEQNVMSSGRAGTGRTLDYPSEYYVVYTPVAKSGYPAPQLHQAGSGATQPVTVTDPPTSAKPSTTQTTKAVTKSNSQSTQTTKAVTKSNSQSTQTSAKSTEKTTVKANVTNQKITERVEDKSTLRLSTRNESSILGQNMTQSTAVYPYTSHYAPTEAITKEGQESITALSGEGVTVAFVDEGLQPSAAATTLSQTPVEDASTVRTVNTRNVAVMGVAASIIIAVAIALAIKGRVR